LHGIEADLAMLRLALNTKC